MQTSDWQDIWGQDQPQAEQFFDRLEPEIDQIVRQGSKSVTDKIRRNMVIELWVTFGIAIAGLIYIDFGTQYWWYLLAILTGICFWVGYTYSRILRLFKTVEAQNIRASLQTKIRIYGGFVRRLKWVTNLFLPLAAFSCVIFSLYQDMEQSTLLEVILLGLKQSWLGALVIIPLLWWTNKYYIHWLYGRYLSEMKRLLNRLQRHDDLN
ncbi:MAG: hypothetical protein AAF598_08575 [Bacteroidota bacterium]